MLKDTYKATVDELVFYTMLEADSHSQSKVYHYRLLIKGCDPELVWNDTIIGCKDHEQGDVVFDLFKDKPRMDIGHGNCTFTSMLSLGSLGLLNYGSRVQFAVNSLITRFFNCSCAFDAYTAVNHVGMAMHLYSVFGEVNEAQNVFKNITERDFILWNIMISMFVQKSIKEEVTFIYLKMRMLGIELDEFTYGSLLVALDSLQIVGMLHSLLCNNGSMTVEVLVASYCRHGRLHCAFQILSDLPNKKLISGVRIISGVLIYACPQQSNSPMRHGKQVLGYTLQHGSGSKISLGHALVTMYSSCETWDWSLRLFNTLVENAPFIFDMRMKSYALVLSVEFDADIDIFVVVHAIRALVYGHLIAQRERGFDVAVHLIYGSENWIGTTACAPLLRSSETCASLIDATMDKESGGDSVQQELTFKIVLQNHEDGFLLVTTSECQNCYAAAVFHRKMIDWGRILVPPGLLKCKTLPLKHNTSKDSSLRTRMF